MSKHPYGIRVSRRVERDRVLARIRQDNALATYQPNIVAALTADVLQLSEQAANAVADFMVGDLQLQGHEPRRYATGKF